MTQHVVNNPNAAPFFSSSGMGITARRHVIADGLMRLLRCTVRLQDDGIDDYPTGILVAIFGKDNEAWVVIEHHDGRQVTYLYDANVQATLMLNCWCGYTGPAESYMAQESVTRDPHTMWRCASCGCNHNPADYKRKDVKVK